MLPSSLRIHVLAHRVPDGSSRLSKRLVAETNEFIEGDYFRRIDARFDQEKQRALQEFDTIRHYPVAQGASAGY